MYLLLSDNDGELLRHLGGNLQKQENRAVRHQLVIERIAVKAGQNHIALRGRLAAPTIVGANPHHVIRDTTRKSIDVQNSAFRRCHSD